MPAITPVLCFVDGEWPLLLPPSEFRGVRLEGLASLRRLVTSRDSLDLSGRDSVSRALAVALPPR